MACICICYSIFLMLGTVGFSCLSALCPHIYGSIKFDLWVYQYLWDYESFKYGSAVPQISKNDMNNEYASRMPQISKHDMYYGYYQLVIDAPCISHMSKTKQKKLKKKKKKGRKLVIDILALLRILFFYFLFFMNASLRILLVSPMLIYIIYINTIMPTKDNVFVHHWRVEMGKERG